MNNSLGGQLYLGTLRQILSVVFSFFIIYILPKSIYGEYSFLNSWCMLSILVFSFGFPSFAMKYCNNKPRQGSPEVVMLIIRVFISIALFLLSYFIVYNIAFSIYLSLFFITNFTLDNLFVSKLMHFKMNLIRVISILLKVFLLLSIYLYSKDSFGSDGVVFYVLAACELLSLTLCFRYLHLNLSTEFLVNSTGFLKSNIRDMLRFYLMSVISTAYLPYFFISIFGIGMISKERADFGFALNMSFLFVSLFSFLSKLESNIIGRTRNTDYDQMLLPYWLRISVYIAVFSYIVFYVNAGWFFDILGSSQYQKGVAYATYLIPILFMSHLIYVFSPITFNENKVKLSLQANLLSLCLVIPMLLLCFYFDYSIDFIVTFIIPFFLLTRLMSFVWVFRNVKSFFLIKISRFIDKSLVCYIFSSVVILFAYENISHSFSVLLYFNCALLTLAILFFKSFFKQFKIFVSVYKVR